MTTFVGMARQNTDRWRIAPVPPRPPAPAFPTNNAGTVAIGLLRHLNPDHLILYEGRRPDRTEWQRHCHQRSEYILAATHGPASARQVMGTLEFRVLAGMTGEWGMIDRLYVAPSYRRRGIASRLLRAAIAFARERGLAVLRESIPNVLVRDPASGLWHPHIPTGEGWGGLRSLGATVTACVREGQPCAIENASRATRTPDTGRIGAILILPIAPAMQGGIPRRCTPPTNAALLDRLLADLARVADAPLAREIGGISAA
jgi:GNAT superfamily N-acetyltransferase